MEQLRRDFYEKSDLVNIIHEFKNEYGERYMIYKYKRLDSLYITGDEMDWESDYTLSPDGIVAKLFVLNESEQEGVRKYFQK